LTDITERLRELEEKDACGEYVHAGVAPDIKMAEGGTTIAHHAHRELWYKEMQSIHKQLRELKAVEDALEEGYGDPFEIITQTWPI
jgi:hypothetical protein